MSGTTMPASSNVAAVQALTGQQALAAVSAHMNVPGALIGPGAIYVSGSQLSRTLIASITLRTAPKRRPLPRVRASLQILVT